MNKKDSWNTFNQMKITYLEVWTLQNVQDCLSVLLLHSAHLCDRIKVDVLDFFLKALNWFTERSCTIIKVSQGLWYISAFWKKLFFQILFFWINLILNLWLDSLKENPVVKFWCGLSTFEKVVLIILVILIVLNFILLLVVSPLVSSNNNKLNRILGKCKLIVSF